MLVDAFCNGALSSQGCSCVLCRLEHFQDILSLCVGLLHAPVLMATLCKNSVVHMKLAPTKNGCCLNCPVCCHCLLPGKRRQGCWAVLKLLVLL